MASSSTPQEQVFINFRGVELRNNFVSHLENRLKLNNINVFIDTYEEKGQKLDVLLNRIEESSIGLAIFSPRYTESEWCLKELAKMKERMDQNKLVVIPIFYKVEPSTVRERRGEFGDKYRDLGKTVDKKIKTTWKEALKSIALIIGFVVDERSDEYELITKVIDNVRQVLRRLSQESPNPPKNVVGLSPQRHEQESPTPPKNVVGLSPQRHTQESPNPPKNVVGLSPQRHEQESPTPPKNVVGLSPQRHTQESPNPPKNVVGLSPQIHAQESPNRPKNVGGLSPQRDAQESPNPQKNVVGLSPQRHTQESPNRPTNVVGVSPQRHAQESPNPPKNLGLSLQRHTQESPNLPKNVVGPSPQRHTQESPNPPETVVGLSPQRHAQESPNPPENVVGPSPQRHQICHESSRGIQHPLKQQEEKLSYGSEETTTRVIGVDCMPGIGKTTFTRRLFGKLKNGFWRNVAAPVPTSSAAVAKKSTVVYGAPYSSEDGASRNPVLSKDLTLFVKSFGEFNLKGLLSAPGGVLGKGTLGTSYTATFDQGLVLAVKRLKDVVLPEKEFKEKLQVLGSLSHVNLVTLIGYYYSRDEKLLIFEYMSRGSLAKLLHGKKGSDMSPLNWETRTRIALGAARAISYLHSRDATTSHGSIKSSNILLSESFEAKVSDYCLKPIPIPATIPNRIFGYSAPEVIGTNKISQKADVYSFGVLLLELLTGKSPSDKELHEEGIDLPRWVSSHLKTETPAHVFDPELTYDSENMLRLLNMGISCTAQDPDSRPSMPEVTRLIEEISC